MTKNHAFKVKQNKKQYEMKTSAKGYYNYYPVFSFKEYIQSDNFFSKEHSNENRNSLYNFFVNLREFSKITWGQMRQDPKHFHFHPFDEDFNELKEYKDYDLDYFKIIGQKQGRFIGYFDRDNVNVFNLLL